MKRHQRRYRQRRKKGLCVDCGAQARPGRARCEACAAKSRDAARAIYVDRVERGVCVDCEVPVGATSRCEGCLKAVMDRWYALQRRRRLQRMDAQAAEGTW